uniref:Uncharacterized protein n=1 Tax=viral metagenome TaxID=1070528 RepID=A0A6C0EGI4_9ZZZZ
MNSYQADSVVEFSGNMVDNLNRLKITSYTPILDIKHVGGVKNDIYEVEEKEADSDCVYDDTHGASVILSLTDATDERKVRRGSRWFLNPEQGKPFVILISAIFNPDSANPTGVESRIGYADDGFYGIYFQHTGDDSDGSMAIVNQTLTGTITYEQADWNIDTLDGTGASNITGNFATIQTYFFELTWNNMLRLGLVINGKYITVHEISSQTDMTVLPTSCLRTFQSISCTTDFSGTAQLIHLSTCVLSEKGYSPKGTLVGVDNVESVVNVNSLIEKPILTLRHHEFVSFKGSIKPLTIHLFSSTPVNIIYKIYKYNSPLGNPIRGLTDDSFDRVITTYDGEYAFNSTGFDATYDWTKILLYQGVLQNYERVDLDEFYRDDMKICLGGDFSGMSDYLVITCKLPYGTVTGATVSAMIDWVEYPV